MDFGSDVRHDKRRGVKEMMSVCVTDVTLACVTSHTPVGGMKRRVNSC